VGELMNVHTICMHACVDNGGGLGRADKGVGKTGICECVCIRCVCTCVHGGQDLGWTGRVGEGKTRLGLHRCIHVGGTARWSKS